MKLLPMYHCPGKLECSTGSLGTQTNFQATCPGKSMLALSALCGYLEPALARALLHKLQKMMARHALE